MMAVRYQCLRLGALLFRDTAISGSTRPSRGDQTPRIARYRKSQNKQSDKARGKVLDLRRSGYPNEPNGGYAVIMATGFWEEA